MSTTNDPISLITKGTQQYCGFRIDHDLLAVPVLGVQEIIKPQQVTYVPLAPHAVRGLINLRGQIVTAIDLRILFGLPEREAKDEYMNVIVNFDNQLVALEVDDIKDVIAVTEATFERTPATLPAHLKSYVKGVHKLEQQLLIVLDLEKLLDAEKLFQNVI
jgi:purine-binding chemotaxis protein CheW